MHEHSFISSILKDIPQKEKVLRIELELGELVGIEKKHLKEHLKEQNNWGIRIKEINSIVNCNCGYKGRAKINQRLHDIVFFSCPVCNSIPKVIKGDKIKIKKIIYK